MKAAVVHSFSAPPSYSDFADPVLQPGEVLGTVLAAGLHQIVRSLASGSHYGSTGVLPFIPGVDGVARLDDGRRVYFGIASPPYGTMAERCAINPSRCLPVPDALDDAMAAALPNPGMSSWVALQERAHFVPGESVLILGATGSSGLLAVQIAKRFGARRIVAVGRNEEALAEAKSLGADSTLVLTNDREALIASFRNAFAQDPIDIVLDYLWGSPAEALLAATAQKGLQHAAPRLRYIQIGSMAGRTITMPADILRSTGLEMLGSGFGSASMERIFAALNALLQEAAKAPFQIKVTPAPLSAVETLWGSPEKAGRIVFQP